MIFFKRLNLLFAPNAKFQVLKVIRPEQSGENSTLIKLRYLPEGEDAPAVRPAATTDSVDRNQIRNKFNDYVYDGDITTKDINYIRRIINEGDAFAVQELLDYKLEADGKRLGAALRIDNVDLEAPMQGPTRARTDGDIAAKVAAMDKDKMATVALPQDILLRELAEYRWGDQRVKVLEPDEFDNYDAQVTLFRGIGDAAYLDGDLKNGWVGKGVWGNGTYYSSDPSLALDYSKLQSGHPNGYAYPAKLSKEAKVIEFGKLDKLHKKYKQSLKDADKDPSFVLADEGRFAASLGYHAIKVRQRNHDHPSEGSFFVILDQSKVVVNTDWMDGWRRKWLQGITDPAEKFSKLEDELIEIAAINNQGWELEAPTQGPTRPKYLKELPEDVKLVTSKEAKNTFDEIFPDSDIGLEEFAMRMVGVNSLGGNHLEIDIDSPYKSSIDGGGSRVIKLLAKGIGIEKFDRVLVPGGKVYHNHFYLSYDSQGKGIAKKIMREAMDLYIDLGVKDIRLMANIVHGAYAWARYGFVPSNQSWSSFTTGLLRYLNRTIDSYFDLEIEQDDINKLRSFILDPDPKAMWKLADFMVGDRKVGKELLSGLAWNGHFDLNDKEAMARFRAYVEPTVDLEAPTQGPKREYLKEAPEGFGLNIPTGVDNLFNRSSYANTGVGFKEFVMRVVGANSLGDSISGAHVATDGVETVIRGVGEHILQLKRSFDFQSLSEKKSATHDTFELTDDAQGKGIAKKLMREAVDLYKQVGIVSVKLNANISLGSYAWARYGFVPRERVWFRLRDIIYAKFERWQREESPISSDDAARLKKILLSADPKAIWQLADFKVGDRKVGKELLVGESWWGNLDLTDKESMDRFNSYVEPGWVLEAPTTGPVRATPTDDELDAKIVAIDRDIVIPTESVGLLPPGDPKLAEFARYRWGDQANELLDGDEFDKINSQVIWRGISDEKYLVSNIDGSFVGTGNSGNGNYYAVDKEEGFYYGDPIHGGWIWRSKLREDAKVIDADDLSKEWKKWAEMTGNKVPHRYDYGGGDFISNSSRVAARLGYDAVRIRHTRLPGTSLRGGGPDHIIVVNQSMVVVDKRFLPEGVAGKKIKAKAKEGAAVYQLIDSLSRHAGDLEAPTTGPKREYLKDPDDADGDVRFRTTEEGGWKYDDLFSDSDIGHEEFAMRVLGVNSNSADGMNIEIADENDALVVRGFNDKIQAIERHFYSDGWVKHGHFELDSQFTGLGLGKTIMKEAVDLYEDMGIKGITLSANITHGAYAWARYGFVPEVEDWEGLVEQVIRKFREYQFERDKVIPTDDAARLNKILASRDPKAIWKLADFTAGGEKIGKELLLDTYRGSKLEWHGALDFNDKESMARFHAYVNPEPIELETPTIGPVRDGWVESDVLDTGGVKDLLIDLPTKSLREATVSTGQKGGVGISTLRGETNEELAESTIEFMIAGEESEATTEEVKIIYQGGVFILYFIDDD